MKQPALPPPARTRIRAGAFASWLVAALAIVGASGASVGAAVATGALTVACSNSNSGCDSDLSPCSSAATYQEHLDVTSADIPTLSITLCRNTTCWSLTPMLSSDGSYTCTSSPDGATCLLVPDEVSGWVITLSTTGSLDVTTAQDQYSVTIATAGSSTPLVSLSKEVTYAPQFTNGPDCPASCELASIN